MLAEAPDRPGRRPSATFGALAYPEFRRVFLAAFVSQTGNWLLIAARAFLIYEITGSNSALGTIYFFSLIPLLLFSQVSGVLADRLDRRKLLVATQVFATLSAVAVGVLADSGKANLANLSALSFLYGTFQALAGPVQQSIVPSLVPREHLASAVSLQSMTNSGSRIFGPAVAGALLPIVGSAWLFYINAITFLAVIAAWMTVRPDTSPKMPRTGAVRAIADAVQYARRHAEIGVPLLAAAVIGGVGLSYVPQVASYATEYLGHGDSDRGAHYYGLIQGALGVGSVLGVIALPRVAHRLGSATLPIGVVAFGVALAMFGLFTSPAAAVATSLAIGVLQFASSAHALTLIQRAAPEHMRGRLVSLYTMAFAGIFPILGVVTGALAERVGLDVVIVVTGATCCVLGLPLLTRRHALAAG